MPEQELEYLEGLCHPSALNKAKRNALAWFRDERKIHQIARDLLDLRNYFEVNDPRADSELTRAVTRLSGKELATFETLNQVISVCQPIFAARRRFTDDDWDILLEIARKQTLRNFVTRN